MQRTGAGLGDDQFIVKSVKRGAFQAIVDAAVRCVRARFITHGHCTGRLSLRPCE